MMLIIIIETVVLLETYIHVTFGSKWFWVDLWWQG